MRSAQLIFSCLVFCLCGLPAAAQEKERPELFNLSEEKKKLIIRIEGSDAGGSGIIVGIDSEYVYGITAKHVLFNRGRILQGMKARFKMWPKALPLEPDRFHHKKDLAGFKVRFEPFGLSADEFLRTLSLEQLGDSGQLNDGDPVFTIGHATGGEWIDSKNPGRFVGLEPSEESAAAAGERDALKFEMACPKGHSGGGAFDESWRLVGMIIDNQKPFCRALRIEDVLDVLTGWEYEVKLQEAIANEAPPPAMRTITVAVVDFDNRSSADLPEIGAAARDITSSALFNVPGVRLVTRDRLDSVLREHRLRGTEMSAQGISRIGRLLDAQAIVTGSIVRYDVERSTFDAFGTNATKDVYRMSVSLQVIAVESGEILYSRSYDKEDKKEYFKASSRPRNPLSRESELLSLLLKNQAVDDIKGALGQVAVMDPQDRIVAVPIVTVPPGAEVFVDGAYRGNTPLTLNLATGTRPIELKLPGYRPWRKRVEIGPEFRLKIHLEHELTESPSTSNKE